MNIKLSGGSVLLLGENQKLYIAEKNIYIKDGKICDILPWGQVRPDEGLFEFYNARDRLIMPSLINMHTHAYMSVMRNLADDVPFDTWLFGKVEPYENNLTPEDAYWSSMLGIMEMISTGTGCFVDMHMFEGQSAKAARDSGIRAYIGRGIVGDDIYKIDDPANTRFIEALLEMDKYSSDTVNFILAPHAPYSCSPKMLSQIAKEADSRGLLKQIHLAESDFEAHTIKEKYGKTPTELLYECGFLDKTTSLAHAVKLSDNDISLIARSGATVVTNPASNAKLGNMIAPLPRLMTAGVNVAIGTDSMASNNTLNMFREMTLLSILHKAVSGDPTAMPAECVIKMATKHAALALGQAGSLGEIRPDAIADLALIDLTSISLFPGNDVITSLCYSASGYEVDSLMVNGKFLMDKHEFLTIDKEQVFFRVKRRMKS